MPQNVAQLVIDMKTAQIKKLDVDTKHFIVRVISEILNDPDFGADFVTGQVLAVDGERAIG